jgi:hypothetical protein
LRRFFTRQKIKAFARRHTTTVCGKGGDGEDEAAAAVAAAAEAYLLDSVVHGPDAVVQALLVWAAAGSDTAAVRLREKRSY